MAKIMVADDESSFRRFVKDVIRKTGHTPVEAEDGKEALKKFQQESIDLSIIDINMPNMTGLDYLEKVKKIDSSAVVIIMTGYPSADTVIETIEKDGYTYIAKPIAINRITDLIERGLAYRRNRLDEARFSV